MSLVHLRQLIKLDFEEVDGATTVRLTHKGLVDEKSVLSHEGGWSNCLDHLGQELESPRSEG